MSHDEPVSTTLLRRPALGRTFTSYVGIGGVAFALDTGLFALLHMGAGLQPLTANVCSTTIATLFSFLANARLTFGVGDRLLQRGAQFAAVSGCGLAISSCLIWLFVGVVGAPALWVKVGTVPVVFTLQFVLNSRVTFAPTGSTGARTR